MKNYTESRTALVIKGFLRCGTRGNGEEGDDTVETNTDKAKDAIKQFIRSSDAKNEKKNRLVLFREYHSSKILGVIIFLLKCALLVCNCLVFVLILRSLFFEIYGAHTDYFFMLIKFLIST